MKRLAKGLAATVLAIASTQAAQAQSTYGCTDLDGFHRLPSVEGTDGVFYRVEPELYNHHPFSDETVEDLARVAQALAQSGTTLIYAPIPPKSMVMTANLPQRAFDYGFDPDIATTLYDDMIDRLQAAGVQAVNVRRALVVGAANYGAPYFKTDFRLNSLGSRIVAQAIAQQVQQSPSGFGGARSNFRSASQGIVEVDSDMRRILQRHCLIELPKTEVELFVTNNTGGNFVNASNGFGSASNFNGSNGGANTNDAAAPTAASGMTGQGTQPVAPTQFTSSGTPLTNSNTQFGTGSTSFSATSRPAPSGTQFNAGTQQTGQFATGNQQVNTGAQQFASPTPFSNNFGGGQGSSVALVGTEYSAEPKLNFAGFLSEMLGMPVDNYSVPGGGAFGAMSAFMTSDAFQTQRPRYLVWENPVYYNLAQYGDQPLRELMAAGGQGCRMPIPVLGSLDSNGLRADLSGLDPMQDYTLMLDTGGSNASFAQFTIISPNGASRTKSVTRRTEQGRTGRFYVPISGLLGNGSNSLEVRLNGPINGTPRITACFY